MTAASLAPCDVASFEVRRNTREAARDGRTIEPGRGVTPGRLCRHGRVRFDPAACL